MFCGSIRPAISGSSLGSSGYHLPVHWDASVWKESSCHHLLQSLPLCAPKLPSRLFTLCLLHQSSAGCPITEPCAARVTNQCPQKAGWGQMLGLDSRFTAAPDGFRDNNAGNGCWISGACPSPKHMKGGKKRNKILKIGMKAAGWQTDKQKPLQSPDIQSLHMRAGTQPHPALRKRPRRW